MSSPSAHLRNYSEMPANMVNMLLSVTTIVPLNSHRVLNAYTKVSYVYLMSGAEAFCA